MSWEGVRDAFWLGLALVLLGWAKVIDIRLPAAAAGFVAVVLVVGTLLPPLRSRIAARWRRWRMKRRQRAQWRRLFGDGRPGFRRGKL